ncbi:MAG TPA: N-acetyltransferase [Clostridiales bacterium]|nr:N-acetyltransferase [Clostridiales bacterium]
MVIKRLEQEIYAGRRFTARYTTNGYYDVCASDGGFRLTYVPLDEPMEKSFDDVFFGEWLEHPIAFGAFEGERLIGYIKGSAETWNNRFRISNLCVFDGEARRRGVGSALMRTIQKEAEALGARMLVLETQSCNEAAIAFYRKNGFTLIGMDLYAYSNTDPERHEVRLEMGKKL